MIQRILTTLFTILCAYALQGQITEEVIQGAGYADAVYYQLSVGTVATHPLRHWDIAFSTGGRSAGIHVNEGAKLSFTDPTEPTKLYVTSSTDFATADTTMIIDEVFNNELSYDGGAFNTYVNPGNIWDQGWGDYDNQTRIVNGTRIFMLQLPDGTFKKIKIESLINGEYTFKYANLDGTGEQTKSVNTMMYVGKTMVYFSFESESFVDLEPTEWDLLFRRYHTFVPDTSGGLFPYYVTGVLSNKGVSVAQADGVDPATVDYMDYENEYTDSLAAIGHDWKAFTGAWVLQANRVYFVKTATDSIWKVRFIDFEGSSTGVTVLERTFVARLATSIDDELSSSSAIALYPNPATDFVNLAFETAFVGERGRIVITDAIGRRVQEATVTTQSGLNVFSISLPSVAAGTYNLSLELGTKRITKKLFIH